MTLSEIYSFTELNDQLKDLTNKLLDAVNDLRTAGRNWAEAENNYRRAKSIAYLNAEGTIPEKTAKVDKVCESERLAAHIAEAEREAAREYVHALKATLSAYQTLARTNQAEAELASAPQPQWR
jgi:cell division septum initiation protein DivIVA